GNAQPRSGVHSRRNAQLNCFFAFEASLASALRAALLHNLSRALACGACARDGEKSLLVRQLTAATAGLAGLNAGALLRAGAVARFAVFLPRQLDLGGYARGRFLERERHVVPQIRAPLRTAASTPTAAAKQVLKAEEISEDVMKILKYSVVKSLADAGARKAGITISVINLALLRIAQHAVGFGAFAKFYFRL